MQLVQQDTITNFYWYYTMSMLYFKIIKLYLMLYAYYQINIDTALPPIETSKVIYSEMRNSIYNN